MAPVPRGSLFLALLAFSCGERSVQFELPPFEGAMSAIFAFHGPANFFSARAVSLDGEVVVSFPVDLEPDAAGWIEALAFDRSLSELGIDPGPIESVAFGAPIVSEAALFTADFQGTETGAWQEGQERSSQIDDIRLPFDTDCTRIEVIDSFQLDTRADHAFTLALERERAVVAQVDGIVYLVEPSGPQEITDIALPRPLTDVVQLGDGSLLFSGTMGRIFTGRITTSTGSSPLRIEGELLTAIGTDQRIMKFTGGREGGLLELFALTQDGGFHRYDGSTWRELHQFGVAFTTVCEVVRTRPGLAYAASDDKAEIVRFRDGVVEPFSPPDLLNGVPALAHFEQIGLVASRSEGGLYVLRDMMDWELLEGSPIALNVYTFEWLESSFLFGGAFGLVSEYRLADGYCPALQIGAGSVREMTPFGDGLLLGEDKPMSRDFVQTTIVRLLD
jgi:hypothetical protein